MSVLTPRVRSEITLPAPVSPAVKKSTPRTVIAPVLAGKMMARKMVAVPISSGKVGAGPGGESKVASVNTRLASFVPEDFFGHQPTGTKELPDPTLLAENLARSVLEILAGARELDQIARWVTDDVYNHLLKRVHISQRARTLKNLPAHRPSFTVGRTLISQPADGVVEAVVIIHGKARTRSVAIRLEGMDNRWRASAVHVL